MVDIWRCSFAAPPDIHPNFFREVGFQQPQHAFNYWYVGAGLLDFENVFRKINFIREDIFGQIRRPAPTIDIYFGGTP
jgi:hypothetical protein